jgi:hypothetical protein
VGPFVDTVWSENGIRICGMPPDLDEVDAANDSLDAAGNSVDGDGRVFDPWGTAVRRNVFDGV